MIRLLQIDYFLEVAEHMSITAAAKKLYISQPALSKQIALLEQELGTRLFNRTARKLSLTLAGEQLNKDLKDIRKRLDEALENASKTGKNTVEPVKIGCFDGRVTDDYLPEILRKLHDYNPDQQTLLSMHDLDGIINRLREGMIDIAFTLEEDYVPEASYDYCRVYRRKTAIVFSPELFEKPVEMIEISDFKDKALLIPKLIKGHKLGQNQLRRAEELGLYNDNYIENENMGTMFMNLKLAKGYAILSAEMSRQNGMLCSIPLDERFDTYIIAVVNKSNRNALDLYEKELKK